MKKYKHNICGIIQFNNKYEISAFGAYVNPVLKEISYKEFQYKGISLLYFLQETKRVFAEAGSKVRYTLNALLNDDQKPVLVTMHLTCRLCQPNIPDIVFEVTGIAFDEFNMLFERAPEFNITITKELREKLYAWIDAVDRLNDSVRLKLELERGNN